MRLPKAASFKMLGLLCYFIILRGPQSNCVDFSKHFLIKVLRPTGEKVVFLVVNATNGSTASAGLRVVGTAVIGSILQLGKALVGPVVNKPVFLCGCFSLDGKSTGGNSNDQCE